MRRERGEGERKGEDEERLKRRRGTFGETEKEGEEYGGTVREGKGKLKCLRKWVTLVWLTRLYLLGHSL